jgi:DNA-binding beta-propeller fold protein YncE
MGLQAIIGRLPTRMTFGAVGSLCLLSVCINLFGYVAWMSQQTTLDARKPAIEFEDFQAWQDAQMTDIRAGKRGFDVQQWTPGLGLGAPKPAPLDRRGQALDSIASDLGEPRGVATDPSGNLYVADPKGARIIRITPNSSLTASWKVEPDSTPPAEPWDIGIDPMGQVWVLDASGRGLIRYSTDGQVLARIGQELGLFRPRGMAIDSVGRVYIADTGHGRVLQLDPQGQVLLTIGGTPGGVLNQPSDVAVSADGSIFVAEPEQGQIHKLDANGAPIGSALINRTNTLDGYHLAIDDRLNLLVLSDPGGGRVDFYRLDLTPVGFADGVKNAPAALQIPSGVAMFQGRVYATEVRQGRVVAYDVNDLMKP